MNKSCSCEPGADKYSKQLGELDWITGDRKAKTPGHLKCNVIFARVKTSYITLLHSTKLFFTKCKIICEGFSRKSSYIQPFLSSATSNNSIFDIYQSETFKIYDFCSFTHHQSFTELMVIKLWLPVQHYWQSFFPPYATLVFSFFTQVSQNTHIRENVRLPSVLGKALTHLFFVILRNCSIRGSSSNLSALKKRKPAEKWESQRRKITVQK